MPHPAAHHPTADTYPGMLVDLDALARGDKQLIAWTPPAVVDGQIVTHPAHRGPLDPDELGVYPTRLRGGIVTDEREIAAIRAHVHAGARRGAWRRTLRRLTVGR